ncbi:MULTISPECIES: type II toxin-antitoxin system RelE/ParE family toxin [Leuconostoc]|uniref:Plasmid addiction system poison protein n=2 Tax=Leuconostoc kimchii TaxID=136609 RepID=D5T497_LEUKI|nr:MULTISPECIES: type II toxin-antitoxin system RelE/ParE family toxin [Leuconostoc]ADG41035.1 Plasmid addiction system poison protein [Leuconostoc kimchii IMSNU 11154]AEJ30993.1 Plasmid addiction system poison protein [Leuconostoc sp. C2]QBR48089.1 type II toxin-antitoxin system RelE/ParE family toxin [Leuconostoc kimchii]
MTKYTVAFADSYKKTFRKLDKSTQRLITKWIITHLHDVDFPTSPGKALTGELSGLIRFRIGDFRIITKVDNQVFIITALYVGKRSEVYKFKP